MMSPDPHSSHLGSGRGNPDRENLSALFDGELHGDAARFALKRLGQDLQWRQSCSTWQLAGDVLRGEATAAAPRDFAERVSAALARETSERAPATAHRAPPRRGWIGGAALAASVAVAALFVARPFDEHPPASTGSEIAATEAPAASPSVRPAAPSSASAAQRVIDDATVAVAELPRRTGERRSRDQDRRAVARATHRTDAPVIAAAATRTADAIAGPDAGEGTPPMHPFQPPAEIVSRPWPRAVLPNYPTAGAFTASYGNRAGSSDARSSDPSAPSFYPFEPRLPQRIDPAASDVRQP